MIKKWNPFYIYYLLSEAEDFSAIQKIGKDFWLIQYQ